MLVLTRRENERIVLPTVNTTIQVVRIAGSTVRLGIDAPANVPVLREELLNEKENTSHRPQKGAGPSGDTSHEPVGSRQGDNKGNTISRAPQYEKLLDCLALAFELADTHLANNKIAEARETLEKALELLRRVRAQHPLMTPSLPKSSGQRVALVIEPPVKDGKSLSDVLRNSGYSVVSFTSGCRAIDYLASHGRPDLIVINLNENRHCGADTIRTIRQNPALRGVKLVALSDSRPAELQISVGPQGVDYWFASQTCPERILQEIEA